MHITPRCAEHDVNLVAEVYKDNNGLVAFYKDEDISPGMTSEHGFDVDLSYHWCPVEQSIRDGDDEPYEEGCKDSWILVIEVTP